MALAVRLLADAVGERNEIARPMSDGALITAAILLSAGAVPVAADHEAGASVQQAASAAHTCLPVIIGSRTPMLGMANSGQRTARPTGE